MLFIEEKGDITEQEGYVIAHCVSCDCAMGVGVAVAICNKHINLRKDCKEIVATDKTVPGFVIRYKDDKGVVYNMFTKEKYWYNANRNMKLGEYESNLREALTKVKMLMLKNNETKLAMPRIGCGLDRCNWLDVSNMIKEIFADTDIEIKICVL